MIYLLLSIIFISCQKFPIEDNSFAKFPQNNLINESHDNGIIPKSEFYNPEHCLMLSKDKNLENSDSKLKSCNRKREINIVKIIFTDKRTCTGFLYSPSIIVTAAHCLAHLTRFFYALEKRADVFMIINGKETFLGRSQNIFVHPEYSFGKRVDKANYDIGIIKLEKQKSVTQEANLDQRINIVENIPLVVDKKVELQGFIPISGTSEETAFISLENKALSVDTTLSFAEIGFSETDRKQLQDYYPAGGNCPELSGAPVFIYNSEKKEYSIVGLISTDYKNEDFICNEAGNYIMQDLRDPAILEWIQKDHINFHF